MLVVSQMGEGGEMTLGDECGIVADKMVTGNKRQRRFHRKDDGRKKKERSALMQNG